MFVCGTYESKKEVLDYYAEAYKDQEIWFDTAVSYNNDYYMPTTGRLISKIAPEWYIHYDLAIEQHLKFLRRDHIDIMLVHNCHNKKLSFEMLNKIHADDRFLEVGVSNYSISDLEEVKSYLGFYPAYNQIEINPDYYPLELIKFCESKEIKTMAYAPLGGKYKAARNIATWTLQGLMGISKVADFTIVKSNSIKNVYDNLKAYSASSPTEFNKETNQKAHTPHHYKYPVYVNVDKNGHVVSEDQSVGILNSLTTVPDNIVGSLDGFIAPWITDHKVYRRYMLNSKGLYLNCNDNYILGVDGSTGIKIIYAIDCISPDKYLSKTFIPGGYVRIQVLDINYDLIQELYFN